MDNGNYDEKVLSDKLKRCDFSRYNSAHKNKLWRFLESESRLYLLQDYELDNVAAGAKDDAANMKQNIQKTNGKVLK